MTWMDRVFARSARNSSRAGAAVAAVGLAPARWTPRRYDRLAEEGYRKNVVAYRCVREVARACASVPWLLYRGRQEMDVHPLLDLLRRPNPRQSGPELIEAAVGHLLLSGNAYLEVVRPDDDRPRELYALRPDRMRVVPDVSGVPRAYRYEVEGRLVDWPVDPMTGASDVLHLRDFHPLDDWYGLSPIEAAAAAIDQHNAAAEHNAALLQNGARPSGVLVFRSDPGPDGIRRVEEALLERTQGPRQAGRPLVLGGDVDWKEPGLSPKDMDFAESKAQAAREIAAAFGVPHLLVVSGEATFSNRADARLELWKHTVIPLLDRLSSALTTWLAPMFGADLRLAHDLDEVPALAQRRRLKWQQIQASDFLTLNEKRSALGYAAIEAGGGGIEQKNSEDYERIHGRPQPRDGSGQWSETGETASPDDLLDEETARKADDIEARIRDVLAESGDTDALLHLAHVGDERRTRGPRVLIFLEILRRAEQLLREMGFWDDVQSFFAEHFPEVLSARQEPRDIEDLYADKICRSMTEQEFTDAFPSAGSGYQWHHILERKSGLAESEIWNTCNIVRIPTALHWKISNHYSSKHESGVTVRQWLRTQPIEKRRAYGLDQLRKEGATK